MPAGYISLILHAHLPYVRHPEHEDFLEERWFFEAMTETYLPLLRTFERLEDDGVDYHLLISMSPTLLTMMEDPLLQERYLRHLRNVLELTNREVKRTRHDSHMHALAQWYQNLLRDTIYWFDHHYRRQVAKAYARLASLGHLEIITCAATHGFLPLLQEDPGAIKAQIFTACDYHRFIFGVPPAGIWLPECAYYPGLDKTLREAGIRFFILDTHGLTHAIPPARNGVYAPVYTPEGVAAFARDPESSRQVWSAEEGYPGHPLYREFYRDIGFELDEAYLGDVLVDGTLRCDTGIKYYRVTGAEEKQLYDPHAAREQAARHAGEFLRQRQQQVQNLARGMGQPPLVVSPYDTELFGHWWFEGPIFIDILLRKMHYDQEIVKTITPAQYLQQFPTNQVVNPIASSWGADGHYDFWITNDNRWVYPLLHKAAHRLAKLLQETGETAADSLAGRVLRQAARELLIAQGSDWTFIIRTQTSPEYASNRVRDHLARFDCLVEMLETGKITELTLSAIETIDKIFPEINLDYFAYPAT
ncbi:MAG: DUF1957 domain-containing protein [Planctomycetes bacterium]|nr:DUF1957 domain-containing protein [Planctomycetota bacterium]